MTVSDDESVSVTTLDPHETILWAQVRNARDEFGIEMEGESGVIRPANHPLATGSIILGDVTAMLLRVFGPHAPPSVINLPGFDEQRWKIKLGDEEMKVEVESRPYWGFGLLASSFLNRLLIRGPLVRRCRLILDLASALGRPPWEPVRRKRWIKVTGMNSESHRLHWNIHMNHCREDFKTQLDKRRFRIEESRKVVGKLTDEQHPEFDRRLAAAALERANRDLDVAQKALHEDNAAAVERAFARIDTSLIEADPEIELKQQVFDEDDELLLLHAVDADEVDIEERFAEAPVLEESSQNGIEVVGDLPEETGAEADDLLSEDLEDDDEDLPFVDLTGAEEE